MHKNKQKTLENISRLKNVFTNTNIIFDNLLRAIKSLWIAEALGTNYPEPFSQSIENGFGKHYLDSKKFRYFCEKDPPWIVPLNCAYNFEYEDH